MTEKLMMMGEDTWFLNAIMKKHPRLPYGGRKIAVRNIAKEDIPKIFKDYYLGWDLSKTELEVLWSNSKGGKSYLLSSLMDELVANKSRPSKGLNSVDYQYDSSPWTPYEWESRNWQHSKDAYNTDIRLMREHYPELSSWSDQECIWAWGGFCMEYSFVSWEEPYRFDEFLRYLRLTQEGRFEGCDDYVSAKYDFMQSL